MGLYTKKRNTFSIKNILFLIIAILFCYLIYFSYSTYTQQNNTIQNSNVLNFSENNQSLQLNELEPLIKKIISENPELILESVKKFQIEQSKIEKAQLSSKNKELIQELKSYENSMFIGFNNADITIYEFVDYNCGYCQKFHDVLLELFADNKNLRVEIIQLPILSNFSVDLAKIAMAANLNGDFEKVHNYLYSSERRSDLPEIFADLFLRGIDIKSIKENINSVQITNKIKEHKALADLFRLNGTPALIIGNEIVPGYIDLLKLMEIISKEFPNNA
ncbi:thioredoxin domain-containing protein [Alphaproteobacteria bacterium]|nr:thioredoxin domain-containing protein [Alphaproteobacteria bacterium]MDB9825219.1 thioredoxin domain-containing protein [Alphaproteobacteria bacterium]